MEDASSVPKRRKQHIQKLTVSVKVEQGQSSDSWSWRKYGQKPIKGSPHPRGYYKCISHRGCPARKQVEKCKNDASLIITYTTDTTTMTMPLPEIQHRNKIIVLTRVVQMHPSTISSRLLSQQLPLPRSMAKRRGVTSLMSLRNSSQCL